MKKLRLIVLCTLGAVSVSALALTAACKSHVHEYPDEWETSATEHYHTDTCGHGTEERYEHTYDASGICTVCGYEHDHTYGEWQKSATEHYRSDSCNHGTEERGKHTYGTDGLCTVCGYPKPTLQSLTLNTDKAKTDYFIGEVYSNSGLSVVANYSNDTQSDTLMSFEYDVDSSDFNSAKVGKYTITVSYSEDGETVTEDYVVSVNSAEISVDLSEATLRSYTGDELNTNGITAKLIVTDPDGEIDEKDITDESYFTIDWASVNNNKAGEYTVKVSYILSTSIAALTDSFTYVVVDRMEGLEVTLGEGVISGTLGGQASAVTIDDEKFEASLTIDVNTKAEVDLSKITVFRTDVDGNVPEDAQPLTGEDVTFTVYLNGKLVQPENGKYLLGEGIYEVKVSADSVIREGFELKAFAFLNVTENKNMVNLVSLTKTEGNTSQAFGGTDEITSTWKFLATYSDDTTKNLTVEDVEMLPVVTTVPGSYTVKVSYTDVNERNESTTKTCDVSYTITSGTNDKQETNSYDYSKITASIEDGKPILQADLTDANAFLTKVEGGILNKRSTGTDNGVIEIRYESLQVTFKGVGTLVIGARSTSAGAYSSIAVKNEDGEYMYAYYSASTVAKDDTKNIYTVTGGSSTSYNVLTFVIPAPGTYTIVGDLAATVNGAAASLGRNTRINQIDVTDWIKDGALGDPDTVSYELKITTPATKLSYVAGEATGVEDLDLTGLAISFKETHTQETDSNRDVAVDLSDCTVTYSGDLSKLNSEVTVTISYTDSVSNKTVTASYKVQIVTPVTGVNSVVVVMNNTIYNLAEGADTVTVDTENYVIKANSATGDNITLGEGESITFTLDDSDNMSAGVGVHTLKAKVVLKNTAEGAPEGTTEFTYSLTIKVKAYVAPSTSTDPVSYYPEVITTTQGFAAEQFIVGEKILDNGLFTLTAGSELILSYGNYSETDGFGMQKKSNEVTLPGTSSATNKSPNVGIARTDNGDTENWFTVTANANITITLYLTYANKSYNSNKTGTISYKVNDGTAVDNQLTARKTVYPVTLTLSEGDVVTFSTTGSDGMGWILGAEAKLADAE